MTLIQFIYIAIAPLWAICLGMFAAHKAGVPYFSFLPNFLGMLIGILGLCFYQKYSELVKKYYLTVSVLILLLLVACLFSTGQENVHRWISLGPIHLNVSMSFIPFILYALINHFDKSTTQFFLLIIAVAVIHFIGPDAGQLTSFVSAVLLILYFKKHISRSIRLGCAIFLIMILLGTWNRFDPLLPVEHVEKILHLILNLGVVGIIGFLFSFLALVAPLALIVLKKKNNYELAVVFIVYFVVSFFVTELGNFPVPVFGAGMASILGWYLMMGLNMNQMAKKEIIRIEKKNWLNNTFARSKFLSDVLREPADHYQELSDNEKDKIRQTQVEAQETIQILGWHENFALIMKWDKVIGWLPKTSIELVESIKEISMPTPKMIAPELFFNSWKGVKYVWGGVTKEGIDCSAFTQRYYLDVHGKFIPKNSKDQRKYGRSKNLAALAESDLICCHRKTRPGTHHVGIYFEGFVWHAEVQRGIIAQELNEFIDMYEVEEVISFIS